MLEYINQYFSKLELCGHKKIFCVTAALKIQFQVAVEECSTTLFQFLRCHFRMLLYQLREFSFIAKHLLEVPVLYSHLNAGYGFTHRWNSGSKQSSKPRKVKEIFIRQI